MSTLSDTSIGLAFVEPASNGFSPLFYQDPGGGALASVNAGNSDGLYVGGAGINGGFAAALGGLKLAAFADRHKALLARALAGGSAAESYAPDTDPMAFSFVFPEARTARQADVLDGVCFVDVFAPEHRPHGVAANAAMLYVAPPYGPNYADKPAFLAAIRQTARNVATTMGRYNAIAAAQGVPEVSVLRLCLFSSGIYNTLDLPLDSIAEQIFGGLCDILVGDDCGITELQFPSNKFPADIIKNKD